MGIALEMIALVLSEYSISWVEWFVSVEWFLFNGPMLNSDKTEAIILAQHLDYVECRLQLEFRNIGSLKNVNLMKLLRYYVSIITPLKRNAPQFVLSCQIIDLEFVHLNLLIKVFYYDYWDCYTRHFNYIDRAASSAFSVLMSLGSLPYWRGALPT